MTARLLRADVGGFPLPINKDSVFRYGTAATAEANAEIAAMITEASKYRAFVFVRCIGCRDTRFGRHLFSLSLDGLACATSS